MGGETARGYYWRPTDDPTTLLDAPAALDRLYLPHLPEFLDAAQRWLTDLPKDLDTLSIIDRLYIESRLSCWAGPQTLYTAHVGRGPIWLFGHGRILDAMLRLPSAYRRRAQLGRDICAREWPELDRFPINRHVGMRLHWERLRKLGRRLWGLPRAKQQRSI
jgi:hypothetical protein